MWTLRDLKISDFHDPVSHHFVMDPPGFEPGASTCSENGSVPYRGILSECLLAYGSRVTTPAKVAFRQTELRARYSGLNFLEI